MIETKHYKNGECSVCQAAAPVYLETKRNVNGSLDEVYSCPNCFVVTRHNDADKASQAEASKEFYRFSAEDVGRLPALIESNKSILNPVLRYLGDLRERTFLEIGSGRGLLLIAASELGFGRVVGVDFNTATFEEARRHYEHDIDRVAIVENISLLSTDVRADCVAMWHVLEHIFEPNKFFNALAPSLNSGCVLYLQVPQYKQSHLCDTHYHFYNEPSITKLLGAHGFLICDILYDHNLEFMTVIARLQE